MKGPPVGTAEIARSVRSTPRKPVFRMPSSRPDTRAVRSPGRCTTMAKSPATVDAASARQIAPRSRRRIASSRMAASEAASMSVVDT
jgi:hypothetical protein